MQIIKAASRRKPDRIVEYGEKGLGKSTWASQAKKPLFADLENRLSHINGGNVDCVPIQDYKSLVDFLDKFPSDAYSTCVIDTLDKLEGFIHEYLCNENQVKSITEVGGGYGKGEVQARELARRIIFQLDILRDKGVEIICIAHSIAKNFVNPSGPDYTHYIPALNEKMGDLFQDWADHVFFCTFSEQVLVKKHEKKDGVLAKGKAISDGERVIKCTPQPAWSAKSHYDLPDELPLEYAAFDKCRQEWLAKNAGTGATEKTNPIQNEKVTPILTEGMPYEDVKKVVIQFMSEIKWDGEKVKAEFYPKFENLKAACAAGEGERIVEAIKSIPF